MRSSRMHLLRTRILMSKMRKQADGQAGGGEGVGEVPHGEEAEGDHGAAEQRAAAPYPEEGVVVVEVPGLLEGVRAVVSRAVAHLLPYTLHHPIIYFLL